MDAEIGVSIGGTFIGTFWFPYHRDAFASTEVVPVLEFDVP